MGFINKDTFKNILKTIKNHFKNDKYEYIISLLVFTIIFVLALLGVSSEKIIIFVLTLIILLAIFECYKKDPDS